MGTFNVQKQIKDNATSVQEYFSDILKWTEEQGKVEKRRERKRNGEAPPHLVASFTPPPRGSATSPAVQANAGSDRKKAGDTLAQPSRTPESIARDKMPMPKYYHDWDQFDAEAEVEKIEDEQLESSRALKEQRQAERDRINDELAFKSDGDRLRTSKAKPRVKINVRTTGRRAAPIDLAKPRKEDANKLFAAGRFKEAMTTYSAALDYLEKYEPPSEAKAENAESAGDCAGEETEALELKVTLLANRAAALLKLEEWREAIEDCEEALRFDPRHHKATLRRGFAYAKQKRWTLAARDLEQAVANDPGDKKAAAELQMARRNLGEQLKETRAHALAQMCDPTRAPTMPTRRLTVRVRRGYYGETATYGSASSGSAVEAQKPETSTSVEGSAKEGSASSVTTTGAVNKVTEDSDPSAIAGVASTSASASASNSGARRPYVPRSVRVRGRTSAIPGSVADTSAPTAAKSGKTPAPAMSFYTFEAQWQRHRKNLKERGALLRKVGARALPKLLRESLDAEIVASIIAVLHSELHVDCEGRPADGASFASAVLDALAKTPRFEASLQSLSAAELRVCNEVLATLEARSDECVEDLAALREAFTPAPIMPTQDDLDEEEDEDDAPPPAEFYEPATSADMLKLQEMILPGDTLLDPGVQEDVQTSGGSPGAEPEAGAAEFSLDGCD